MSKTMNVPVPSQQTYLSVYDPQHNAELWNRLGQYCYRTGDIERAKTMFFLSKLYDGTFQIDPQYMEDLLQKKQ